ncbi:MAG: sugar phosphate nucleotidyltransferase [Planctomycetota bacterium]|jgi:UTP--glucose-1-phosphate uridylyltransferase|nr:sugar phosphate nucleotidyltransferase [Planctomycetota bacterium]
MKIRKALITAAAPAQHTIPLQKVVDCDGKEKTALQHIVEEVANAGVEEICLVIQPGDQAEFCRAAGDDSDILHFAEQPEPLGYADAILRGKDFVGDEPFLHLVGDHLYVSSAEKRCARQLIDVASQHNCSVSAVQPTRENNLKYFGAIGGSPFGQTTDLYEIATVVEKPTPTEAEQDLVIAGLRSGFYQCFFGMHVLSSTVMTVLSELFQQSERHRDVSLSDALAILSSREKYLAFAVNGSRYNIGEKYGVFVAQAALALQGTDRDQILSTLVELLSTNRLTQSEK